MDKYEEAMKWLEYMKDGFWQSGDDTSIIEYIQEMLWQYNDLRNS